MKEAMKAGGSNKFKQPHMQKGKLEREGRLPVQISCEALVLDEAKAMLAAA